MGGVVEIKSGKGEGTRVIIKVEMVGSGENQGDMT